MANTKITALTALTTPASADIIPIVDDTDTTTKKITFGNIQSNLSITESQVSDLGSYQTILTEGAFVDGDKTKLDGIEALADVTDTANVTSAGALMDSELTSIADVKALDQSVVSGASPVFATTNMTEGTNKNFVTDAEATVIGNTSGTNTGDEVTATTSTAGVVTLATDAETLTASSDTVVMTPGNFGANIIRVYKTTNETVNNSTTLQNDDELLFPIGANEVWGFYLFITGTFSSSFDWKCGWTVPSGTTMQWSAIDGGDVATITESGTDVEVTSTRDSTLFYSGVVDSAGTSGNVQLQWAQNVMFAGDLIVKAGSYLIATRLV